MKGFFYAVALCMSFFSLRGNSATTCSELNDLWNTKFHSDFKIRWQKSTFNCPSSGAVFAQAIYDVYKPTLSFDFYDWAQDLVKTTYYEASCPKGVVATMRSDGLLKICPAFYTDNAVSRAGTIVHEAAHALKEDPGHVTCTKGSSKGARACDQVLYDTLEGSGYSHEFNYFTHLLTENSHSELDHALLRHNVKYMLFNRFNYVSKEQISKWANI